MQQRYIICHISYIMIRRMVYNIYAYITSTNDKYYVVHKQVNQSQTSHLGRCTLQAHGTEVLVSQRVKDQISMVCRIFQPQMMSVSEIRDPDCQYCAVPDSTCLVGLKVVLLCSHGTLAASQNSGNCDRPIISAYEFLKRVKPKNFAIKGVSEFMMMLLNKQVN